MLNLDLKNCLTATIIFLNLCKLPFLTSNVLLHSIRSGVVLPLLVDMEYGACAGQSFGAISARTVLTKTRLA